MVLYRPVFALTSPICRQLDQYRQADIISALPFPIIRRPPEQLEMPPEGGAQISSLVTM